MPVDAEHLWPYIRDIPDFPQPGVVFKRHHAAAR